MPEATISNVAGAFGNTASPSGSNVIDMVNNAAAARVAGDVVILSGVAQVQVATTTTANNKLVVGVVGQAAAGALGTAGDATSYAVGAVMPVIIRGPARINIGSNTVAANDLLTTSTTAGVAQTNTGTPAANAVTGSIIGVALEADTAKDSGNTIRAWIDKI